MLSPFSTSSILLLFISKTGGFVTLFSESLTGVDVCKGTDGLRLFVFIEVFDLRCRRSALTVVPYNTRVHSLRKARPKGKND